MKHWYHVTVSSVFFGLFLPSCPWGFAPPAADETLVLYYLPVRALSLFLPSCPPGFARPAADETLVLCYCYILALEFVSTQAPLGAEAIQGPPRGLWIASRREERRSQ